MTGTVAGDQGSPRDGPDRSPAAVEAMFDRIAARYDLVNRLMTLGADERWRRRTVASLHLPAGSRVLDVACGTGDLCRALRAADLVPIGVDRSRGMLEAFAADAARVRADAFSIPARPGGADGVVCGFGLRNFPAPGPFLAECARVLRPGGRLAILETSVPELAIARSVQRWYLGSLVPRIGAAVSDEPAYRYLPRTTAELPPPGVYLAELRRAGLVDVERATLGFGAIQLLTAGRP